MAVINGQPEQVEGMTITSYLVEKGYDPARVAVEIGGEILPKIAYSRTVMNAEDSVEIVAFVGGG